MAERPIPDSEQRSASYSPPPNHRPGWIGEGWGGSRSTQGRQGVARGWSSAPSESPEAGPGSEARTSAPARRRTFRRDGALGMLGVAIVAAALASAGTYGILLATGQL